MTITQKHVGCSEVPANTSPRVCRALFCSGPFLTLSFGNLDLRHDMGLVGREGVELGRLFLPTCVTTSLKQCTLYTNKSSATRGSTPMLHTSSGAFLLHSIVSPVLWEMGREKESCTKLSRGNSAYSVCERRGRELQKVLSCFLLLLIWDYSRACVNINDLY